MRAGRRLKHLTEKFLRFSCHLLGRTPQKWDEGTYLFNNTNQKKEKDKT